MVKLQYEVTINSKLIFHQLFEQETSTYTYLLADSETKEAILVDTVLETVERDFKLLTELGLKLKYILDTHVHADHITGAALLKKKTGAQSAISHGANVKSAEVQLKDGEELQFGQFKIKTLETPGHTDACLSFYCEGMVFTGDALMIRAAGRTDFQQGSNEKLYHSIKEKLYALPDQTIVFPGHDYRGMTASTIEMEKKFNPRIGETKSLADFSKIMNDLKLAHPKKIHASVPANLAGGIPVENKVFHPQIVDGVPEVSCQDLNLNVDKVLKIDVRRSDEFTGELGHIKGAILKTQGSELFEYLNTLDKEKEIVFICRSGGRSARATLEALAMGFKNVINMSGGMIRWNELKLEIEK